MGQCSHNHNHAKVADRWTQLSAMGEFGSSFISNAYWLGGLLDLATGMEQDFYALSKTGFWFGVCSGFLTAVGSAYCHKVLNVHHQQDKSRHYGSCEHSSRPANSETSGLIGSGSVDSAGSGNEASRGHTSLQKGMLSLDYLSHIGGFAGPFMMAFVLGTASLKYSRSVYLSVHLGFTVIGAITSYANIRTCAHAALQH